MVELPKNNKTTNQATAGFKAWVNRHPVWTIILTIVAFAFIVSLFSGDGSNVPTTTTAPSQQTQTNVAPSTEPKPKTTAPSPKPTPTPKPTLTPVPTPTPTPAPSQTQLPKVGLISSRLYRSGNYIYLEGEAKNISGQQLKFVEANVVFKDQGNNFISSDTGYLKLDSLPPGQSSTFKIIKSNDLSITQADLSFLGRVGSSIDDVELSSKMNITFAAVATPPPSAPKSWHTVTTFSGSGNKKTEVFTIQGVQWRINWTAIATNSYCLANGCNLYIFYLDPTTGGGDSISSSISGTKSDVGNFYKSGTFYLDITGSTLDSWSITIEDYY